MVTTLANTMHARVIFKHPQFRASHNNSAPSALGLVAEADDAGRHGTNEKCTSPMKMFVKYSFENNSYIPCTKGEKKVVELLTELTSKQMNFTTTTVYAIALMHLTMSNFMLE